MISNLALVQTYHKPRCPEWGDSTLSAPVFASLTLCSLLCVPAVESTKGPHCYASWCSLGCYTRMVVHLLRSLLIFCRNSPGDDIQRILLAALSQGVSCSQNCSRETHRTYHIPPQPGQRFTHEKSHSHSLRPCSRFVRPDKTNRILSVSTE